ncbi:class I glutamine amidotransferase-like protein [Dactylonectria estremocensis]|uniref:Class I glutamine amidotransferase-like protein n=1 Tax=Dactylonectria estremocensis TaxID=1079267 RepID=A0A9P9IW68_9HYPO|nr:class I glutamine amidotransferase-like protein [Dactylonectria estremocensis]
MAFNLKTPNRKIHAGVILVKGITEMIDVAPFEFFAWFDKESLKMFNFPPEMLEDALDIELHWVTEDGKPNKLRSGAQLVPTDSFESCPPLDIALMGAHGPEYKLTNSDKAFVRKSYESCSAFLSICGGIFALLEAGLLQDKTVSAPRLLVDTLKTQAPQVNWQDKRWSHDGKIWSSSTLLNGTDLMRAFATETWGGRNGMVEAALDCGHYPDRDVDFNDFHGHHYPAEFFPLF